MKILLLVIKDKKKMFSVLTALFLIDLVLFLTISFYQRPRIEELQTSWFEKRRLQKAGDSRTPSAVYQEGKADLAKFRERIPAKREYTRLVGELLDLAENNDVSIDGINYKPTPVKGENLVTYTVTMDVEGKYAGVKSLIGDIQQLPQIITLDSLALNGEGLTEELVNMKFQLTVYLKTEGV